MSEQNIKAVADFLVGSGLAASGYDIVWLDGGWARGKQDGGPRDASGNLVADPSLFPSGMAALAGYLHGKGLRAGIYTDAGDYDAGGCGLGSYGHYDQDARLFARWGYDAVKVDFLCGISANQDPEPMFRAVSQAVWNAGRPMLLNLCNPLTWEWGKPDAPEEHFASHNYTWGVTSGDSWRTGTDIAMVAPETDPDHLSWAWQWVMRAVTANSYHPEAQGPGHYNDPDYLIPMRPLGTPGSTATELTFDESVAQFMLWAEMGSPLIIGSDPRTLPSAMLDVLRNSEILAVDQDPLARQGVPIDQSHEVFSKVLAGSGQRAVVLLNQGDAAANRTVSFVDAGLTGTVAVRDLGAHQDRGSHSDSYTVAVPRHGAVMLKLSGTDRFPGSSLGQAATASPALVRSDTRLTALYRGSDGSLRQQTGSTSGGSWSSQVNLGGPTASGQILGQPAAYGSSGGRIDLFVRGTDNAVWTRVYANGGWGGFSSLGGTVVDAPSVAFQGPGNWNAFAPGADGAVWWRTATSGWSSIGSPNGRPVYGRPAATMDSAGRMHILVRSWDDSVWERQWSPSGWGSWVPLGGVVGGSPTVVAVSTGVYAFVLAGDGSGWQNNYNAPANQWSGWFKRPEFPAGTVVGALGGDWATDGHVLAAYRGKDGVIHQTVL